MELHPAISHSKHTRTFFFFPLGELREAGGNGRKTLAIPEIRPGLDTVVTVEWSEHITLINAGYSIWY